jgi:NAD(P)-dependent dehydrogenase (short-subunit alcohol dehydrogenase family)
MSTAQVWFITGASRGLGLAIAKTALSAGHKVIACYRTKTPKTDASMAEVEALGGVWFQLDVAAEDVEARVRTAIGDHGKIDVLVNNAAYGLLGSIEDSTPDMVNDLLKVNVFGPLRIIQAILPSMRARSAGAIVNISSTNGFSPAPGVGLYSTTKFALEALTEAFQAELAPFNIRMLLVEPGLINTDLVNRDGAGILVPLSDSYKETILPQVIQRLVPETLATYGADPNKVASRVVEAVDETGAFEGKRLNLRLPLGQDCGAALEERVKSFEDLVKETKDIWAV